MIYIVSILEILMGVLLAVLYHGNVLPFSFIATFYPANMIPWGILLYPVIKKMGRWLDLAEHGVQSKVKKTFSSLNKLLFVDEQEVQEEASTDFPASPRDTSSYLCLFEKENGFKYLTHDIVATGIDYREYVDECLARMESLCSGKSVAKDVSNLVKGFVSGPSWIDYNGREHNLYLKSVKCESYYESTKNHPLNFIEFQSDIDAFRHSIRFRNGKLYQYFDSLKEFFPNLNISIDRNVKSADFYIDTRHFRNAVVEILSCMNEYNTHPNIVISYEEDDSTDSDYVICHVIIEQKDSFSSHTLKHDIEKLEDGGGTFDSIKRSLYGNVNWSVVSRWSDSDEPMRWNILSDPGSPQVENAEEATGFKHIISIYQDKP